MEETDRTSLLQSARDKMNPELAEGLPAYVGVEVAEAENLLGDEGNERGVSDFSESDDKKSDMAQTRLNIIIGSMCLGSFLAALDNTIVTTLLSHIASEFNELSRISWISTAYLLSSATFQPLYGKISDIFGRRPLIIISNLFFIVGCLICGLSKNLWTLVIGRFIAGIGGGGVTSLGSIALTFYVPVYWSSVLNLSPTEMGKRIAPNFFSTAFGSVGAGYYMKKTGRYYSFLLKFAGLMAIGQLQILLMKPDISTWRQFTLLPIPQFGAAVLITVTLLAMIAAVPHEHQAATTSISYAFRSTGSTLGVSIGAALFRNRLSSRLYEDVLGFESEEYSREYLLSIVHKAVESSEYVHTKAPKFIQGTLIHCYESACHLTFSFCFVICILAWISCSIIKEYKLHTSMERK